VKLAPNLAGSGGKTRHVSLPFVSLLPTFRKRSVGICHVPKHPAYGHKTASRRVLNLTIGAGEPHSQANPQGVVCRLNYVNFLIIFQVCNQN
jgi:hypothetical protein